MRVIKSQKFSGYLTYQLFVSDAFRSLKPASRDILALIYFEVKLTSAKKRGKYTPVILNRDNIKAPYVEIQERLGYSKKTIWTAFKEILAHGFLEVVENGGGCKGDCKVYKISEKWREWKQGQIINEIGKNGKIGWQKQKK
jgi:hypothetical protein